MRRKRLKKEALAVTVDDKNIAEVSDMSIRDIEAMLESSQRNVTGTAILKLMPKHFETVGVDSPNDLVKNKLGEYGEVQKGWTAEDAKGFIKVTSTPLRAYYANHPDEKI